MPLVQSSITSVRVVGAKRMSGRRICASARVGKLTGGFVSWVAGALQGGLHTQGIEANACVAP